MADNNEKIISQSDLDRIGVNQRKENETSKWFIGHEKQKDPVNYTRTNDYSIEDQYSIYDHDGDLHGKGTEAKYDYGIIALNLGDIEKKTYEESKQSYGKTINTDNGGGEYDRKGYGALEGKSGRDYLVGTSALNKFKPTDSYGEGSVLIEPSIDDGQYIVQ